jgi:hypothetical protein
VVKYWPMSAQAYLKGAHLNPPMSDPLELPIAIVWQVNAPPRRLFLDYPTFEEWKALDRAGVHVINGSPFPMADALH